MDLDLVWIVLLNIPLTYNCAMMTSGIQSCSRRTEILFVPHSFSSQLSPSMFHSYINAAKSK